MGQHKVESPLAALQIDSGLHIDLYDQFGYRIPLGKYCWLASKSKVELGMLQNDLSDLLASIRCRQVKFNGDDLNGTKILNDNDYSTHQEASDIEL